MKHVRQYALGLLSTIVFGLGGCIADNQEPGNLLKVGDRLPEFTIDVIDNSTQYSLSSRDLAGHEAVIVFFNTGCQDCRKELPEIERQYREDNKDKSEDERVVYVCISREESEESVRKFWDENGLTLPYSPQEDRAVYNLFSISGIPRIYHISADGIIIR